MTGRSIGPYRVLRKLGAGGMGDVYLAEDERLGRQVALKSPSDSWLQAPDARARLQREARAAARLNHPHIAGIYDVLEDEGRPFIVMEFVEGESLATLLSRGPLPVERALVVARQLLDGLAAAHAAGVIHRDLKPGNVMITADGQVKILDFGLAKTHEPDPSAGPLTTPGQMMGTPGYVAPEQLLGRPTDVRSDIYSAGAILFQLLSGRSPWEGLDEHGRGLGALLAPAPGLSTIDPTLPRSVCDIVARALEREPGDRFDTAEAFRQAIEGASAELRETPTVPASAIRRPVRRFPWWGIAAVSLLLAAAAATPFLRRWRSAPPPSSASSGVLPVIAVLPLENLSGDPALQYIAAGMAETMSTKLASVSGLIVISRAEIHDAMQRNPTTQKLFRALGASYVVSGTLQQAGDQLQVTINVMSPDGRRVVSGDIYDGSMDDVFVLQRGIAEGLTRRIVGTVSAADRAHLERNPTSSVQALSAYWRARDLLERPGPESIDPAIAAFEDAVARDPQFAIGYAGLGSAYWRKYDQAREAEWAKKAIEAAERARQIDPNQPEVRYALATVYRGSGRGEPAIAELKRVIELQPTSDGAHRTLGDIYAAQGRTEDAIAEYNEAVRLRPEFWATYRSLGVTQMGARRYDEATRAFERITALQPDSPIGYQLLGTVHATVYELDAALQDYQAALARGGTPATHSAMGTVYYWKGRFADAAHSYEQAITLRPNSAVTHYNLADAYRRLRRESDSRREYASALRLFEADLQVNAKDATALARHATCLARLGRAREGVEETDRAAQLAPQNQDVQYHRALTSMLAGNSERALDALQQAVADGYSLALLRHDDEFAALRGSRRFQALLAAGAAPRRSE